MNEHCYYGDHRWNGGACQSCGQRFRCPLCGVFLRVDDEAHWERHLAEDVSFVVEPCQSSDWHTHERIARRDDGTVIYRYVFAAGVIATYDPVYRIVGPYTITEHCRAAAVVGAGTEGDEK